MKFDSSLRPQDKKTIAIVLYVAVVILFGWYMIRPAWLKLSELDDKIEQANLTKQEYTMKSINLGTAEVLYEKAVTDIETQQAFSTMLKTTPRSRKWERNMSLNVVLRLWILPSI